MSSEEKEEKEEHEPQKGAEVAEFGPWEPGPCCICGKPDQEHGCFRCGRFVCIDETDFMLDSACGGWILDWWHPCAFDPDDGNEFWCRECFQQQGAHTSGG